MANKCNILKKEFIDAIQLILNSTYFKFEVLQNFGIPMNSPLSPIIADLMLQNREIWDRGGRRGG